jgi:F-type H+-transporting ATPase subunit gamma
MAIEALRPYAVETMDVLSEVAARAGDDEAIHPLLARREAKRVMLVVLTSDRGLAGAFNASICREAFRLWKTMEAEGKTVSLFVIGRKGNDYFKRRGANLDDGVPDQVFENLTWEMAEEIGTSIISRYEGGDLDSCIFVYNEFKSAIQQEVIVEPLLPITPSEKDEADMTDFIYEPGKRELLNNLIPMYVRVEVYRALLESVASEHGARMTAMDSATNNASDMLDRLTLEFNRARQAAITTELMEIIGGAEALKG